MSPVLSSWPNYEISCDSKGWFIYLIQRTQPLILFFANTSKNHNGNWNNVHFPAVPFIFKHHVMNASLLSSKSNSCTQFFVLRHLYYWNYHNWQTSCHLTYFKAPYCHTFRWARQHRTVVSSEQRINQV